MRFTEIEDIENGLFSGSGYVIPDDVAKEIIKKMLPTLTEYNFSKKDFKRKNVTFLSIFLTFASYPPIYL